MITCDLIGRLGNQLFQIATTAATACRNGTDFAFPTNAMGSYTGEVYIPNLPIAPHRYFPVLRERSHAYHPIPTDLKDIKLHGYWQSEKYFAEYQEQVLAIFGMPPIPQEADCSIHIRLGDYVKFKDKHPPVTIEYIDEALKHMINVGCKRFLIFSDDTNAARDIISQTKHWEAAWFDMCFETDPKTSIQMMAGCDHNIIANSSFSWWGAWLNPNPDKIVIAPKVWFGPGNRHLDPTDIYCENWIKM